MSHIARELKMLFYLNSNMNRYVKIDELADLLEITPRQVRRYRDDLDQNGYFVDEDITNVEIQILATYMKCEWLNRTILTWENVKPLYVERDFSQANLIEKFKNLLEREEYKALKLERIYYRSRKGKPFDFTKLAGD